MKKIILINLFMCITLVMSAQCDQPYKSFDKFANDTTAFLRYNFKTRADCYKGKTVAQVLADLQIVPKSCLTPSSIYEGKYQGLVVYVDNTTTNERIENPKRKTQYVYIYWKDLLNETEVIKLVRKYGLDVWTQKHYNFFKNNIVGEVFVK